MRYRLTVLTPTLVGDGTELSPIDYMVWRDQVNVLNQPRIFKLLSKGPRLEGYLTQLRRATTLDFASWGGFAQNFADRRIPFEDPAYTPYWNRATAESLKIPTFTANEMGSFIPGAAIKGALRTGFVFGALKPTSLKDPDHLEQQTVGSRGSDRMRVFTISDSGHNPHDAFKVYLLRVSTLIAKGAEHYNLGWKQAGKGSVDGKRPEDATPTFAEMAVPGTVFDGEWRENDFLNREEVRQSLHWHHPVTHERLFESANRFAAKQLEIHAQYAKWSGLEALGESVAELQRRAEAAAASGGCLLSIGWGGGLLSKSALIGADEAEFRKLLTIVPSYQRALQSGLPFPKTRRIVFLKNKPATLPGWVELRVA